MAEKNKTSSSHLKQMRKYLVVCYVLVIIAVIAFLSSLTISKTDKVLTDKVSTMTTALNMQMKMNIDSYLNTMETTGALIFACDEVYSYKASDPGMDQYEALNTEKIISDNLFDICIMENFVDFGIVYGNNHTVGKISNGTASLFGEKLYTDMSAMIKRKRTHDGWATGYMDDFKRIYYVKRINDDAVLVTSFYTTELETVFEHPEDMIEMNVRLTDSSKNIIYSSVENEIGTPIPDEINSRIGSGTDITITDDRYLVTINSCGDDWYVICSIPTAIILSEKNEITLYILIAGAVALIIAVIMTVLLSFRITNPIDSFVTNLDSKAHHDQLTGLLNKRAFEDFADMTISSSAGQDCILILLDVDNFKGVNDTLGHIYGDKVLANIGNIIRSVFQREEDIKGRIGGDEFGILARLPMFDHDKTDFINTKCEELCAAFRSNYTGDDNSYKISASIGVAVSPKNGSSFNSLYKCADKALYESKNRGKDTYTIFNESGGGNEN